MTLASAGPRPLAPLPDDPFSGLERFYGGSDSFPEHHDGECTVFADGWAVFVCTNWARAVRRIEGPERCELFGFLSEEVPESEIARQCGGHDFAVVDGRYLVDGWAKEIDRCADVAVFDLDDAATAAEVLRLYGPRSKWPRNLDLEAAVDAENAVERAQALAGAKIWRRTHEREPSLGLTAT